jgi:hypothetical protein
MLKMVVVSPNVAVTGGVEALHQLVATANEIEAGSAAILYYPSDSNHDAYSRYDCPVVQSVPADALVVLPEIWPHLAQQFPANRCALWWLSVDNFGSHHQTDLSGISLHLCQSEYAWEHVRQNVGGEQLMVTDWVDVLDADVPRLPRVVLNPAKDAGLLRPFMAAHPHVEFVELRGLGRTGVAELLWSSQVYIDFGRHPGRDRPPREAASAGCVVLSTKLGAAGFDADMPLDDCYKFDSLDEASVALRMVLADWDAHHLAQSEYRSVVANQRSVFRQEVGELLESIS